MKRFGWLGAFGVLWGLAGCGKSEGGPAPIPKAELPARIARLVCESMAGCCQKSGHSFDVATCKSAYQAEVEEGVFELESPNIAYDAQAAGECLDAVGATGACGDVDDDDAPACRRVFRGTLALGAACVDSDECREEPGQSVSCTSDDGLSPEVCTLQGASSSTRRGKLGEACNGTCSEGSDCNSFAVPPQPAPGPGVPAPPGDPALCYRDDGLWCNYQSGSCESLLALGAPCTAYDSCGSGNFCDFYSGACSAPAADGAPCDGDDGCRSDNCVFSDSPQVGTPGPSGTCLARGAVTAEQCEIDVDSEVDEGDSVDPAPAAP
jgi:hypothetical protein